MKRIAVIDDSAMFRDFLCGILTKEKFSVTSYESGKEFIRVMEDEKFDLVLLDAVMPELDGLAILKKIREKYSMLQCPVIMVTGKSNIDFSIAAFDGGVNDFVTKPFDVYLTLARVKTHLQISELEQKLEEQQRKFFYAAKMSALSSMAAGVAHEINNKLTIVTGLLGVYEMQSESGVEMKGWLKDNVPKIKAAAEYIGRTVRSLRQFALDERQSICCPHSIQEILEGSLTLCRARVQNAGVELIVNVPADLVFLECRMNDIQHAIYNLILNSFEAVKRVDDKWIKIEVKEPMDSVVIDVIDSGQGVSSEIRHRLKEPFVTTKKGIEGQGLGLSVADGIVRSHSGSLEYLYDSEFTTFRITLPKLNSKNLAA